MMNQTKNRLKSIHDVSDEAIATFLQLGEIKEYEKNKQLFSPEKRHHYLYVIEKGAVRAYSYYKGKQVTFWLGMEGDFVFPYRTFVYDQPSYETVELLEDCMLNAFLIKDLRHLMDHNFEWSVWGRKFMEKELVAMEERFISYQFKTAKERYDQLINEKPEIFNRIQLQHIASYLGITQVSLSRIRGNY
ncbi:MAG: Crp/Fnr family transcriptional regulator [Bacteroidota bacterium]